MKEKKKEKSNSPAIIVKVPRTDRMKAINNLSAAIFEISKALSAVPQVTLANNVIVGAEKNGIEIKFSEEELE